MNSTNFTWVLKIFNCKYMFRPQGPIALREVFFPAHRCCVQVQPGIMSEQEERSKQSYKVKTGWLWMHVKQILDDPRNMTSVLPVNLNFHHYQNIWNLLSKFDKLLHRGYIYFTIAAFIVCRSVPSIIVCFDLWGWVFDLHMSKFILLMCICIRVIRSRNCALVK